MIIRGNISIDDRGFVRFVNDFTFKDIKRFYQVSNHEKGFIRAWHGHKIEGKYAYVARGTAQFGVISMDGLNEMEAKSIRIDPYTLMSQNVAVTLNHSPVARTFILSDKDPSILYIAPGNYNGFQTLGEDTIVIFFSTLTLEESRDDDYRQDYEKYPIFIKKFR